MAKAKRARKAETPKQPSPCLRLRAPYLYPDRLRRIGARYGDGEITRQSRQHECKRYDRDRNQTSDNAAAHEEHDHLLTSITFVSV